MKLNIVKGWKAILVSVLAVLLIGMVMLGIFGLNNTKDYDKSYQLKTSISLDIDGASEKLEQTTEKYLKNKGIKTYSFGAQTLKDGRVFTFQVKTDNVNIEELRAEIEKEINNSKINVKVTLDEVAVYGESQALRVVGALAIAVVALFIALFFFVKWKSALTVALTSILSALVFFAMMNIVRIPAVSLLPVSLSVALLISAILSTVVIIRYKEIMKNPSNSGKSFSEIANKGVANSLLRICFVCLSLVVLGGLIAVLLCGYSVFFGLQLALASLVAGACTVFVSPLIWVLLNEKKA